MAGVKPVGWVLAVHPHLYDLHPEVGWHTSKGLGCVYCLLTQLLQTVYPHLFLVISSLIILSVNIFNL